jgi:hypothetical protein
VGIGLLFAISALTAVVLFIVLEVGLRVRSARRQKRELEADARQRLELHLPPYSWHPYLGQVHAANYSSPTCVTDEYGFRNRYSVSPRKPDGEYRVLLAGGSTAAGAGAPDGKTIRDGLQAEFDRESKSAFVLNVAQSAFNSSQELVQVALILLDFEPDALILINGRNDFFFATRSDWQPHITYRMSRFALLYENARQRAVRRASFAARFAADLRDALKTSQLLSAVYGATLGPALENRRSWRSQAERPTRVDVTQVRNAARIYCENVRRMAALATTCQCQLYVFMAPSIFDTQKQLADREVSVTRELNAGTLFYQEGAVRHYQTFARWADEGLGALATKEGFVYRNCRDVFDHLDSDVEVFLDDCHLTPEGQAILSKAIFQPVGGTVCREPSTTAK